MPFPRHLFQKEQTTGPPAPFPQLLSYPKGLPYQEFNTLLVCVIKSSHFRLIGTLLIDLHFLLFHFKANTSLTRVTPELFVFSLQALALFSKLLLFSTSEGLSPSVYYCKLCFCCFFKLQLIENDAISRREVVPYRISSRSRPATASPPLTWTSAHEVPRLWQKPAQHIWGGLMWAWGKQGSRRHWYSTWRWRAPLNTRRSSDSHRSVSSGRGPGVVI